MLIPWISTTTPYHVALSLNVNLWSWHFITSSPLKDLKLKKVPPIYYWLDRESTFFRVGYWYFTSSTGLLIGLKLVSVFMILTTTFAYFICKFSAAVFFLVDHSTSIKFPEKTNQWSWLVLAFSDHVTNNYGFFQLSWCIKWTQCTNSPNKNILCECHEEGVLQCWFHSS